MYIQPRLESALDRAVIDGLSPLHRKLGLCAHIVTEGESRNVLGSHACPGTQSCAGCEHADGRLVRSYAVRHRELGQFLDSTVNICMPPGSEPHLPAIEGLIRSAERIASLESENESLFHELDFSWESLSSIHRIAGDPTLLMDLDRALDRVLDCAVSLEPGLEGILWVQRDGRLEPRYCRTSLVVDPRDADVGHLGDSIRNAQALLVNPDEIVDLPLADEPELRRASRFVTTPIQSHDESLGVLEIWHEEAGRFDSRFLGHLRALASHALSFLENDRLRQQSVRSERIHKEIEIAAKIQQVLLLGDLKRQTIGVDIASMTRPSDSIDGDFFEFFHHRPDCVDLIVGDVMGKGIPAALIAAAVKGQFLRFASSEAPGLRRRVLDEPELIVSTVHDEIAPKLFELRAFVTACFARIDARAGRLTYVDCGHTETLHYRSRHRDIRLLREDEDPFVNLPLGLETRARYRQVDVDLEPGDVLVFYSDGITEAKSPEGEAFDVGSLVSLVEDHPEDTPEQLANRIGAAVSNFAHGHVRDDLTCVVVRIEEIPRRTLVVPGTRGHLRVVREFLAETCRQLHAFAGQPEEYSRVELAVVEAATNIIKHAYRGGELRGEVEIEVIATQDEIRISLEDNGDSFAPERVPVPELDGTRSSGFGIYMMRQALDEVIYSRSTSGKNCITLVRRFKKKERRE